MNSWFYSANVKYYDVLKAFEEKDIYWPINSKVAIGDIVYIYLASPYKQIGYVCMVEDIGLPEEAVLEFVKPFFKEEISKRIHKKPKLFMRLKLVKNIKIEKDSKLSLEMLKAQGLNGMLLSPRKLENSPELLRYIINSSKYFQ